MNNMSYGGKMRAENFYLSVFFLGDPAVDEVL